MAIDDIIGKREVFETIVGKHPFEGGFAGDVPEFEIKPENVDTIYLAVKKFQRCYHNDPTYPVAKYYADSFSKIEEAYLSKNAEAFKEAVAGLMMDIDAN